MKTLEYTIQINASPEQVWNALWDEENYKKWTTTFCHGSYYKTDGFQVGNKIHFLTPDGQGMYSLINQLETNQYVAFRHIGAMSQFEELPVDKESETWTNAMEIYHLSHHENGTKLRVSVDIIDNHIAFMNKTFPLALSELKKISEQ